ncbi:glycosyltransferase family 39 protein [Marinilabilia salmonicolor]|jgi:4-amino-4-deoxy-L-arabinose transferase|uniref:4-amino-4-deoxy-L-arabinose transferase n=1 Tax=Marinilabilia salmonicolor TaxID=989 RepID=A0A2T0XRY8_9BACT|nr:glycosyltransferase family 39 protein [Marinilabilia salmonicolor]PRZ01701.1 4-amino-4-deoxy-L-arabinose transferase [Marinilabilia salmonicolor]RCW31640.1 4-amino-4-deoxy-L-arabinose transferase [Marinilabilia salmonicolor]
MKKIFTARLEQGKYLWFIILISAIALLVNLNGWGVTETSEARYAEIAYEMYQSGDYLHPRLLEIQHYHKPPVTYWITALSYHIFGPNAFGARFFLQIMILIQIWLVFRLSVLFTKDKTIAITAALIYISFPAVLISARALTTDAFLNTFVLLSVFFWAKRRITQQPHWLYLTYLSLGLGFMTKGPVVFIIPAVTLPLINHLFPLKQKKQFFHHISGLMVFLFSGISWYLFLVWQNPEFIDYFVIDHTINRFATNQFNRGEPFWFYLAFVPAMSFPWFILSIYHSAKNFKSPFSYSKLLWLWIAIPLFFFSLSTSKLILYVLPVFPAIAIIAANTWGVISEKNRKRWSKALAFYHILIIVTLLSAGYITSEDISFSVGMYVIIGLMGLLISFQTIKINRTQFTVPVASAFTLLLVVFSTYFMQANPRIANDQRNVAIEAKTKLTEDGHIMVYDRRLPSVAFHAHQPVISIFNGDRGLNRETRFEKTDKWKHSLIDFGDERLENPAFFKGSVLIARLSDARKTDFQKLKNFFTEKETLDGWVILYNSKAQ